MIRWGNAFVFALDDPAHQNTFSYFTNELINASNQKIIEKHSWTEITEKMVLLRQQN